MKKLFWFVLGASMLLQQEGISQGNDLRYEILLNETMPDASLAAGGFAPCLDVSPQRLIALSRGNQLYLLGWGGMATLGNPGKSRLESFACTADGLLLAVMGKELCSIDREGNWKRLLGLPSAHMSVTAGREVLYLCDRVPTGEKYHVYALAKQGKYRHLLASPGPVNGVCESGDSVYFAIGSGIFSYSPRTNQLSPLLALEKGNHITSLTVDQQRGIFYFSTQEAIYAFRDNLLIRLTEEFPGSMVRHSGDGLIVFNAATGSVFRIVHIENSVSL